MSEPTRLHDATAARHVPMQMALGVVAVADQVRALAAEEVTEVDAERLGTADPFMSALLGVLAIAERVRAAAPALPDVPPPGPGDDASWLR